VTDHDDKSDRASSQDSRKSFGYVREDEEKGPKLADISNVNDAIFERMIIILPYKAPDMVKSIERTFERLNCEGLNLENARYLATKELTLAEA
jgi:hypothetical protein